MFFGGLIVLSLIFTPFYIRWGGASSLHAASSLSFGITLNVSSAVNPEAGRITLVQKLIIYLWTAFCAMFIPQPTSRSSMSLVKSCVATIALILILSLFFLSVFTNTFFIDFADGFSRPVTRGECFFFALSNLVRAPYGDFSVNSIWMRIVQLIEVNISFFLTLVGFKAILSILREAMSRTRFVG